MDKSLSEIKADNSALVLNAGSSVFEMRIKSLCRAYGFEKSFLSFYADSENQALISVYDNHAIAFFKSEKSAAYYSNSLNFLAASVLSNRHLALSEKTETKGNIYINQNPEKGLYENVSEELDDAFAILKQVFPESFRDEDYNSWYADSSHRIRHGESRVFTIPEKATVSLRASDKGRALISEFGTVEAERRKGYGKALLAHLTFVADATEIALFSQSKSSDEFYEGCGYKKLGEWYVYE